MRWLLVSTVCVCVCVCVCVKVTKIFWIYIVMITHLYGYDKNYQLHT